MSFVIDSNEWDFNGQNVEQVSAKLEQLLARVDIANQRGEKIFIGNDLQSQVVCGTMDLWGFLYSEDMADISEDIISELTAFFGTGNYYEDDSECWPTGFPEQMVSDIAGCGLGPDLSFAHLHLLDRTPFACITLNNNQSIITNSVRQSDVELKYIFNEINHKEFWREAGFEILRDNAKTLKLLAPNAYPNLHFFKSVWDGIVDFEGGYVRVSAELRRYLAVLDDIGHWFFTEPPPAISPTDTVKPLTGRNPTSAIIEERFKGAGLTMAPEKPNVRIKDKHRKPREILFEWTNEAGRKETKILYCEWHGKIEAHTNRVHIYPPIPESGNRLIVAIFHKHLPLP